jgi:hypothetical protein
MVSMNLNSSSSSTEQMKMEKFNRVLGFRLGAVGFLGERRRSCVLDLGNYGFFGGYLKFRPKIKKMVRIGRIVYKSRS